MKTVNLITYGSRHRDVGSVEANYDIDCRHLANPHGTHLKKMTGLDTKVQAYVFFYSNEDAEDMVEGVEDEIIADERDSITVAFHCIGGKHRSVSVAERLAKSLRLHVPAISVNVNHMELAE